MDISIEHYGSALLPKIDAMTYDPTLLPCVSLSDTRRTKKLSLITPARSISPARYTPDRTCLAPCLAAAAKGTEAYSNVCWPGKISSPCFAPYIYDGVSKSIQE